MTKKLKKGFSPYLVFSNRAEYTDFLEKLIENGEADGYRIVSGGESNLGFAPRIEDVDWKAKEPLGADLLGNEIVSFFYRPKKTLKYICVDMTPEDETPFHSSKSGTLVLSSSQESTDN